MIRLYLAIGKCYRNTKKTSVYEFCQNVCRNAGKHAVKGQMKCPNGCSGKTFHKDGTYQRKLVCYENNEVVIHEIMVACVECKECGQTHAVLPPIAIFHSQFSIQFAVQLMQAYLVRRYRSVNEMCQVFDVSVTTFYRLLHSFKRDWKRMLKLVQEYSGEIEKEIEKEIMKFAQYPCSDMGELLRKFYNQYRYSFMCFGGTDST